MLGPEVTHRHKHTVKKQVLLQPSKVKYSVSFIQRQIVDLDSLKLMRKNSFILCLERLWVER